jgi:hypothetical protein
MNRAEAMEKIEGLRFSALTNLASDFGTFLRIVLDQPEVQSLQKEMQAPDVRKTVCERTIELARADVDPAYEHPADAALATYIWLLSGVDDKLAKLAADAVSECSAVWWARKAAEKVLASDRVQPSSSPTQRVLAGPPPNGADTTD